MGTLRPAGIVRRTHPHESNMLPFSVPPRAGSNEFRMIWKLRESGKWGRNGSSNLVGGIPTPLKNMSSSAGMIIPNIWENKKCSKPPTSNTIEIGWNSLKCPDIFPYSFLQMIKCSGEGLLSCNTSVQEVCWSSFLVILKIGTLRLLDSFRPLGSWNHHMDPYGYPNFYPWSFPQISASCRNSELRAKTHMRPLGSFGFSRKIPYKFPGVAQNWDSTQNPPARRRTGPKGPTLPCRYSDSLHDRS